VTAPTEYADAPVAPRANRVPSPGESDDLGIPSIAARIGDALDGTGTGTSLRPPAEIDSALRGKESAGGTDRITRARADGLVPTPAVRYELAHKIAGGGMSEVWAAADHDVGRIIAVKLLEDGLDATPAQLGRFIQEAQVTGQLEHPNIVPVHELNCSPDGRVFFTMKRVRGISLAEILFRLRYRQDAIADRFDVPELLRVLLKVCDGVAYAHDRGVVHRDLKPTNIMVGRFGDVLVMDWGIAKILDQPDDGDGNADADSDGPRHRHRAADPVDAEFIERFEPPGCVTSTPMRERQNLTAHGNVVGTPKYMAPEQATDGTISERTDIYQLGAILYEILTLHPPFDGDSSYIVVREVADGMKVTPRKLVRRLQQENMLQRDRAVPRELDEIVIKAMAKDPDDRYPSVPAFAADVRAFLEQRPVSVYRDSTPAQIAKWARRHPAVAVGVTLLVVFLGISAILTAVTLDQVRKRKVADLAAARRGSEISANRLRVLELQSELREQEDARRQIEALRLVAAPPDVPAGQARRLYDRILELDPDHVATLLDRGLMQLEAGDLDGARRDLDRALALRPDGPRVVYYRARLAEQAGEPQAGLELLGAAGPIRADSTYGLMRAKLVIRLLAQLHEYDQLQHEIDRLLAEFPAAAGELTKLRVLFGAEERAVARARTQTQPSTGETVVVAGSAAERLSSITDDLRAGIDELAVGRLASAQRHFHRALGRSDSGFAQWYLVACAQAQLGDLPAAMLSLTHSWNHGLRELGRRVLDVDPDLKPLRDDADLRNDFDYLLRQEVRAVEARQRGMSDG
jgi:serine/threonine protein kinase/tetratricopeptide (TPR) repeat protein